MASRKKALLTEAEKERGCLWCFGGVFVIVGGAIFWFVTVSPLIQLAGTRSWVETPCVIESSRLDTFYGDEDDGGDTYAPDIRYSYAFGDGDYEGDQYSFVVGSSSGLKRH